MKYDNIPPSERQSVDLVKEWIDAINSAVSAGLVAPSDVSKIADFNAAYDIGILSADLSRTALSEMLSAGPAADKALDAIAPLFAPGDVIEVQAIDPAGGGAVSRNGRLNNPNERAAMVQFIQQWNGRRNLYFGVNPREGNLAGTGSAAKDADVAGRRALFLDLDNKDAPDVDPDWTRTVEALRGLAPLLVTQSGNGSHVFLGFDPVMGTDAHGATARLREVMARLGADNMADLRRVARLPFTVNLPTASKRGRGAVARIAQPDAAAPTANASAGRSLDVLCTELEAVAERLALPGKGSASAGVGAMPANIGTGSGEKTPEGAPSANLLRMALNELPNAPGGPFDDRAAWVAVGHAVKGAAVAGGVESEGREAWIEWCGNWGGDPDHNTDFWDNCQPNTGWGTLMRELERVNPAGRAAVQTAEAHHAFCIEHPLTLDDILPFVGGPTSAQRAKLTGVPKTFRLSPVAALGNTTKIPPRRWLYARSVIGGYISMLVAPGGSGKSALCMVEALAMATGKELLAGDKPHKALRVWVHNAEDSDDEQQRRLAAAMQHHGLTDQDLDGRLFLTSGRSMPLQIARQGRDGPEVVPGVVDQMVEVIEEGGIDVLILDPLGALHTLPENSNEAANVLMGALREISHRTGISIVLVHHTGKGAARDMDAAGAGASRGASAFVDAARSVRQLVSMTPKEAAALGIPETLRWRYIRIANGKANLARPEDATWVKLESVNLWNGTAEYPNGDEVQTVSRWVPPQPQSGTDAELAAVQAAIANDPDAARHSEKSPEWVGYLAAEAMGLDIGTPGSAKSDREPMQEIDWLRVKRAIADWIKAGHLIVEERPDKNRHKSKFVGVGKPAPEPDAALDVDADGTAGDGA